MNDELKALAKREPNDLHSAFVKWMKREAGVDTDNLDGLQTVTVALRLHPHFRLTDEYRDLRESARLARVAEDEASKARGAERTRARIAKLDEDRARLEAKLSGVPTPVASGTEKAKAIAKAKPAETTPKAVVSKPRGRAAAKAKDADAVVTPIDKPRGRRGRTTTPAVDDADEF